MIPWIIAAAVLAAAPLNHAFDSANAAYEQGDPAEAARIFERLVAEGVREPAVFYNLGNAYAALERHGAALANYDRALALDPDFADAAFNSGQVRAKASRGLLPPAGQAWEQAILFWDDALTPGAVRAALAAANLLLWALLALRLWRPLPYLRLAAVAVAAAVLLLAASAWAKANPPAVVYAVQSPVAVRYGPAEGENQRFELYDGDAAVIVDERPGGWYRLRTIDGESGWASASGLLPVGPPYMAAPAVAETSGE